MTYTTDTFSLSYELVRDELRHQHVPLLFLHSALGTRKEFDALQTYYPDRTLILLDLPSHGESTTTLSSLRIRDLSNAVHSLLIDHLHIPVVDIIGYSMGGYTAIDLAIQAPAVVRSIVSHAMKFYWTEQAISDAMKGLDPAAIKARSEKAYVALSSLHAANGFERTAVLAASIISSFSTEGLSEEAIASMKTPLLLSVGDSDAMVPPEEVSTLYLNLPKEKTFLAIHPNSPHPISRLDLHSFTESVTKFWRTLL